MKLFPLISLSIFVAFAPVSSLSFAATEIEDPIVVTATRSDMPLSKVQAPITVFTQKDIEQMQARYLIDLLNKVPGIDFSQTGAPSSVSSLHLRGSNTSHTLVMIDGQRIESATLGNASIHLIDLSNIERVEIVRGSQSSLYGSDAIGGIIQLFTKQSTGEKQMNVKVGYGSNNTSLLNIDAGTSYKDSKLRIIATSTASDGINSSPADPFLDLDENEDTALNLSFHQKFNESFSSKASYTSYSGERDHDDLFSFDGIDQKPFIDYRLTVLNLEGKYIWSENVESTVLFGSMSDEQTTKDSLALSDDSSFETERTSILLLSDYEINKSNSVNFGLEQINDEIISDTIYFDVNNDKEINERKNSAAFIHTNSEVGNFIFDNAIRYDDNESFGSHSTYNLTAGYHITDELLVSAISSTGFKAPTFNDLYFPEDAFFNIGNPDIQPEESTNHELGLTSTLFNFSAQVNVYLNEISDLIEWQPIDPNNPFGGWSPINVSKAKIKGSEISVKKSFERVSIYGNASYIKATNTETNKNLTNRAQHIGNIGIDIQATQKWFISAIVHGENGRFSDTANDIELAGFGTLNIATAYNFTNTISAELKADNLFDRDITRVSGFNTDNTFYMASIKAKF